MKRAERLDAVFAALAEPLGMSQPAISKHLKVLGQADLISRGRDVRRCLCRLRAEPLAAANQWIERYRKLWEPR